MVINIFYILGVLGLLLIISGILIKNRNRKIRNLIYILGGIFLTIYSVYIKDPIFITLQIIFVLVATYDLKKHIKNHPNKK